MSKDKTFVFFAKDFLSRRKADLLRTTSFSEGIFPFTYLGALIVSSKLSGVHFDPFLNKVIRKLGGWKLKCLSSEGKIILIKHVLSSFPIHLMSILNFSQAVLKSTKSLFSSFSWGEIEGKSKKK